MINEQHYQFLTNKISNSYFLVPQWLVFTNSDVEFMQFAQL